MTINLIFTKIISRQETIRIQVTTEKKTEVGTRETEGGIITVTIILILSIFTRELIIDSKIKEDLHLIKNNSK